MKKSNDMLSDWLEDNSLDHSGAIEYWCKRFVRFLKKIKKILI